MDRETPGWSSAPARSACNRSDLDKRRDPHRTLDSEPPTRMSDHTTGGTDESRRKIATHPSPRVHLLVDSMISASVAPLGRFSMAMTSAFLLRPWAAASVACLLRPFVFR